MWGQLLLKYFDKQLKRGWILKTINFNSFLLKFTIFSFIYYMLRQKWKGGKSMIFHFWYLKLSVCSLPPPHPDATCLWCVHTERFYLETPVFTIRPYSLAKGFWFTPLPFKGSGVNRKALADRYGLLWSQFRLVH